MSRPIHPLLMEGLRIFGRAGLAALDSALEDGEKILNEATGRVKRTRVKVRKAAHGGEEEED